MIEKRMVLPDRIQLVCSPDYNVIRGDQDYFKNGYNKAKEKNWIVTRPRNRKGEQRPTINIPEDLYIRDYPYITHITVNLKKPYSVGMEFNFIRFLKRYCRDSNPLFFNSNYDEKIRIHEDNYIDNKIIQIDNSGIYDMLIKDVSFLARTISEQFVKELFGVVAFDYEYCSIKQIEFNIDHNVGSDQSLDIFDKLIVFLLSDNGYFWRQKDLQEVALKLITPRKEDFKDLNPLEINEKLRSHYLFFEICKGMKFKIYRKTTDHIRDEIIFESNYIKRNYPTQQFDKIYETLYEKAKQFINKTKFNEILQELNLTPSYTKRCQDRMTNTYGLIGKLKDGSGLQEVYDAVYFGDPVITQEGFDALNNNPDLKRGFVRRLSSSGQKIYLYSPDEAYKIREEKEQEKKILNKIDDRKNCLME
ncbi:Uncharacterised protein [uncultured archaeon]|nr:Uncharacterised protein [uncultured archaeon]